MFLPIHDQNGLKYIKRAYVNYALIIANILVWIVLRRETVLEQNTVQMALGFIPGVLFNGDHLDPSIVLVPTWATFVTYAFFHIDFMHIAVNLLFLFVFGDNVEDALGHFRYAVFYLACAAFGALVHGLTDPTSQIPLIGASGAISGLFPPTCCCIRASASGRSCSSASRSPCPPSSRFSCGLANNSTCWRPTIAAWSHGAHIPAVSSRVPSS